MKFSQALGHTSSFFQGIPEIHCSFLSHIQDRLCYVQGHLPLMRMASGNHQATDRELDSLPGGADPRDSGGRLKPVQSLGMSLSISVPLGEF